MGGEKAVKSGDHGQKMVNELLKMLGWHIGENDYFNCTNSVKHKLKAPERKEHNIDGFFQYNSPLNHDKKDVILISIKHNKDGYASNRKTVLKGAVKDLAQCVDCVGNSEWMTNGRIGKTDRDYNFIGVIFYLSSNLEERDYDLISECSDALNTLSHLTGESQ